MTVGVSTLHWRPLTSRIWIEWAGLGTEEGGGEEDEDEDEDEEEEESVDG